MLGRELDERANESRKTTSDGMMLLSRDLVSYVRAAILMMLLVMFVVHLASLPRHQQQQQQQSPDSGLNHQPSPFGNRPALPTSSSRLVRRHLTLSGEEEEEQEGKDVAGSGEGASDRGAIMKVFGDQPIDDRDYEDAAGNGGVTIIELASEEFYVYRPGHDERRHSAAEPTSAAPRADGRVAPATSSHSNALVTNPITSSTEQPTSRSASSSNNNTSMNTLPGKAANGAHHHLALPASRSNESVNSPSDRSSSAIAHLSELKRTDTAESAATTADPQRSEYRLAAANKLKLRPYCLGQKDSESTLNWLCQGLQLIRVPSDLEPKPMSLRLSSTGIESLARGSLMSYRDTLRDFSIENAPGLVSIEAGTFDGLTRLRVVYIFQAPKLVSFDCLHPDLTIVRIQQTGLRKWPDFSQFRQHRILNSIDLDNNKITTLGPKPINMRIELLNLEFNHISSVDEFTFNGSEIGILSLSGNRQLAFIHPNAFSNLKNLVKLDLSSTSLQQLPTVGLHQLRSMIIRDTYALKRIPSIYVFPMLEDAQLTYAYHCCWFRYPQRHDPTAYEEHLKLQAEINRICADKRESQSAHHSLSSSSVQQQQQSKATTPSNSDFEGFFEDEQKLAGSSGAAVVVVGANSSSSIQSADQTVTTVSPSPAREDIIRQQQQERKLSSNASKRLWLLRDIECGELAAASTVRNITCTPEPDAFNPCEDIMGYSVLRVAVWFVVGASVFGNLSVIVVLGGIFRRLSVPKFLQLNLAIGDMFMGVYLGALALADLTTVGSYFNYALDWQHGLGCKVAGAASLFASQLSIFSLSVITFERYYTITYSIDLNMRLQLGWAARIMVVGWLYAFTSAMLPIFADINSYSKTSICLPMRTAHLSDRLFIFILLFIDSTAFVIIFACYLKMYLLILRQKTQATAKERTVAMRMALLVSTDFACWAPIIFFSTTALFGWPLISVTNSKILIVFFYPLNSMANPFLYVISTRQYRRDLNYLTTRWTLWRKNLFRRNQDSCYYSNNNPYAVAGNQYMNSMGLNVHLGAVAAVTGVASHPRYNNTAPEDGGKACQHQGMMNQDQHEQRVISTKSHQGRYVIRHQILMDKHSNARVNTARNSRQGLTAARRTPQDGRRSPAADELDWSGASKLALPAVDEQELAGGDRSGKNAIEMEDRLAPMPAKRTEEGGNKKRKCRQCNTSSLASCCTRCCCCKPKPTLTSCGTLTTIISNGAPTSQQPQPLDTQREEQHQQVVVALEEQAHHQSESSEKKAKGPQKARQDSSVTILGNISSYTEPTSSYSTFSSNSQFEVPAITIRGYKGNTSFGANDREEDDDDDYEGSGRRDELHLHICSKSRRHPSHRPQHSCSKQRDATDPARNHHRRHHSHSHHHHHNHPHHGHRHGRHRRGRTHQENHLAQDEITDSTNPSSASHRSLEPLKRVTESDRVSNKDDDEHRNQPTPSCRHRRHRHRRTHHHAGHGQSRSRCSCRGTSPDGDTGELDQREASKDKEEEQPASDGARTKLEGPKDSLASTCSQVSKQSAPLGSILKTTPAMSCQDGGDMGPAPRRNKEQLSVLSFMRGGSLRTPNQEKKKVCIISPHHSG